MALILLFIWQANIRQACDRWRCSPLCAQLSVSFYSLISKSLFSIIRAQLSTCNTLMQAGGLPVLQISQRRTGSSPSSQYYDEQWMRFQGAVCGQEDCARFFQSPWMRAATWPAHHVFMLVYAVQTRERKPSSLSLYGPFRLTRMSLN